MERKYTETYQPPPPEETMNFLKNLDRYLALFLKESGILTEDVFVNRNLLIEVFNRVDQRSQYYRFFHSPPNGDETIMSQIKEVALTCFWIIKYKPFYQTQLAAEKYYRENTCTINEMLALYMLQSLMIQRASEGEKEKLKSNFFTKENNYVIIHNFMHRDISKEAFILYFTSLVISLEV